MTSGRERNAQLSDTKDDWYGATLQTEGTPMVDSGTGRPLVLRTFEFAVDSKMIRELKTKKLAPTRQDLFNAHWPQIRALIWSDGLVANTDVEPRVIVGRTRYRIFILCEAKLRTMIADKPQTLQQVFKKKS